MLKTIYRVTFGVLAVWAVVSCFIIFRGSYSNLSTELDATKAALGRASITNVQLTGELRQLRRDAGDAYRIAQRQQQTIDNQQSRIESQQRIIDGIQQTIKESGGDIRKQINAIADGFGRLYSFYNQSAGGSKAP